MLFPSHCKYRNYFLYSFHDNIPDNKIWTHFLSIEMAYLLVFSLPFSTEPFHNDTFRLYLFTLNFFTGKPQINIVCSSYHRNIGHQGLQYWQSLSPNIYEQLRNSSHQLFWHVIKDVVLFYNLSRNFGGTCLLQFCSK